MALATLIIAAVLLAVPLDPGLPPGWAWRTPYSATGFEDGSQYSGYVYLLGLLNALLGNQQFGQDLGARLGMFNAGLNQQTLSGLLGGL